MNIKISMQTRDNSAYADGIYDGEHTIVKAGGRISSQFHGSEAVRALRNDPNHVDGNGNILMDCEFNSPSTAAQFVNGNISNGLRVWKANGETLGQYLKDHE